MEIEQSTQISPGEWDAAVAISDDTWMFHTTRWIEMTASVWPLDNRYFTARKNGRMVGGFALQVAPGGRRPWIRPRAYSTKMGTGGPFAVKGLGAKARERTFLALNEAVLARGREQRLGGLECSLPPLAPKSMGNVRGINPLVALGWNDISTHTQIVDLSLPVPELESALSRLTRRKIKRSSAEGYTVAQEDWGKSLDEYYQVHQETYHRTGASPHPKAYFDAIAGQFAPQGNAVLWVCRNSAGEPVAFYNCARFAEGAVSWTACSRTGHGEAGVNYLLLWRSMLGAKEEGFRWYEVGEIFPGTSDEKLKGLSTFKSKFGGELYRFYRGEYRF